MDPRIPSCFFERGLICGYASTANFRSVLEPMGAGAYGTLNDQAARFIEIPVTPDCHNSGCGRSAHKIRPI